MGYQNHDSLLNIHFHGTPWKSTCIQAASWSKPVVVHHFANKGYLGILRKVEWRNESQEIFNKLTLTLTRTYNLSKLNVDVRVHGELVYQPLRYVEV